MELNSIKPLLPVLSTPSVALDAALVLAWVRPLVAVTKVRSPVRVVTTRWV